VRILLIATVVMVLAWLVAEYWRDPRLRQMLPSLTAPPAPVAPAAARQAVKDCRDQCEQTAVVEQLPEERMLACRARCEERDPAPPPTHEPIRRITVAPPDHSRTIRSEK
jgi:hypothetical protein